MRLAAELEGNNSPKGVLFQFVSKDIAGLRIRSSVARGSMCQAGACCCPWKAPCGDDSLVDSAAGLCIMVLTPVTQADAEAIAVLMAQKAFAGLKG